jgi:excisionase family DNA binding protein
MKKQMNQGNTKTQGIDSPIGPRLLPLKQAAEYIGFSTWAMREAIWSGLIPFIRKPGGRKIWIDRKDLDRFIEVSKVRIK